MIFHLSFNVYLLNLCHKHKWLQHFLYAFQIKSTPAFLLTESILLLKKKGFYWEILADEDARHHTVQYWYLFIWVQRNDFKEKFLYVHIEDKASVKALCCSSRTLQNILLKWEAKYCALNRCCKSELLFMWILSIEQMKLNKCLSLCALMLIHLSP